MTMHPMVDRWRMSGSFQPFLCLDVRLYGFVFPADLSALRETCDRYLNRPSGGEVEYVPLAPVVIVTFARLGRLRAEDPPYRGVGWAAETEATFWIVAPPRHRPLRPTFFAPYIVVDLPLAIGQGREIFGFPKEIGWFDEPAPGRWRDEPADGSHADRFTLDVFGVDRFAEGNELRRRRLLEIGREPRRRDGLLDRFLDHARAAAHMQTTLLGTLRELGHDLLDEALPRDGWPPIGTTVLLKQIPDVASSRVASYQAVVEAGIDPVAFRAGGLLDGPYTLDLHDLESHPLGADLGLRPGARSLLAYWMDFDFRLRAGEEVWTADRSQR
jgi:hypothetical protein